MRQELKNLKMAVDREKGGKKGKKGKKSGKKSGKKVFRTFYIVSSAHLFSRSFVHNSFFKYKQ